MSVILNIS